jgi:integrase
VRTVPLPQVVRDLLAAHLQRFGAGEHDLIFHDESGGALNRDRVNDTWRRAQAATGKTARMHDCRHYYARVLIAHGANVKVVQARLGQASAKETLDMYANQWPDSEDETRNAVDAEFGSPADSLRTTTWS